MVNKRVLSLVGLLSIAICCYGQAFYEMNRTWERIFPLSANQFEHNNHLQGTFMFRRSYESYSDGLLLPEFSNSMLLPVFSENALSRISIALGFIEHQQTSVQSIKVRVYFAKEQWDKIVWEEHNEYIDVDVCKGMFVSLLNTNGSKKMSWNDEETVKYKRDELGRVVMIFIYHRDELINLYRYTYSHPSDTNIITTIEKFTSRGKRMETVDFVYEGNSLVQATFNNQASDFTDRIELNYTYDEYGNVKTIRRLLDNNIEGLAYFEYKYSDGKIQSCSCKWGDEQQYSRNWEFKYDERGNWSEILIPSQTKYVREILYK